MKALTISLMLAFLVMGCDQKKDEPEAPAAQDQPEEAPKEEAESASASDLAPEIPETDVPELVTPADYELEASKTIALENLEAELDRLDAEIQSVTN